MTLDSNQSTKHDPTLEKDYSMVLEVLLPRGILATSKFNHFILLTKLKFLNIVRESIHPDFEYYSQYVQQSQATFGGSPKQSTVSSLMSKNPSPV